MKPLSILLPGNPPRIEEVQIYFNQKGMSSAEAECFFFFYEMKYWTSRKGGPLRNWKSTAYQWIASLLKKEPWRFNKDIH
ncbi:hypothetical protein [Chitinophaga niabensis]|uniref:Uncharacterized protein n=1 Tax=Chitinophaga niabensis TaxID=536979 RepID=A0A1N6KAZ0_9BACT|nr:hypothetical protein [Chitinophaga niabensis]SIO53497.1 hypothetical protein SAMN04488055_5426 [Chitinophaga niabensis]